jgi:hypothetical protein
MSGPAQFLEHTPWWADAIFVLLVVLGAQALRARRVAPWRLLPVPIVFMVWGLVALAGAALADVQRGEIWAALAVPGLVLGWWSWRGRQLALDGETGAVLLAGSLLPLLRNMVLFLVKYALNAAPVVDPSTALLAGRLDSAVSGLLAGYFLAWLLGYRRALARAAVAVTTLRMDQVT